MPGVCSVRGGHSCFVLSDNNKNQVEGYAVIVLFGSACMCFVSNDFYDFDINFVKKYEGMIYFCIFQDNLE